MILKTSFCLRWFACLIRTLQRFFLLIWRWFELHIFIKRSNDFREQHPANLHRIKKWRQFVAYTWIIFALPVSLRFSVFLWIHVFRIAVLRVQERTFLRTSSKSVSIDSERNVWPWTFWNESLIRWLFEAFSCWLFRQDLFFLHALWNREMQLHFQKGLFSYYREFMIQIRFNSKKQFRVASMSATALCAPSKSFQKSLTWSSDSFGNLNFQKCHGSLQNEIVDCIVQTDLLRNIFLNSVFSAESEGYIRSSSQKTTFMS